MSDVTYDTRPDQPGTTHVQRPGESLRADHAPVKSAGVQTILVGLDGSPEAGPAVELSLRWARAIGARVVGLGIVDEPTIRRRREAVPMGAYHFKHQRDERLLEEARRRVEQLLQRFAQRCAEQDIACTALEKIGVPQDQIGLAAQAHDLVVLPRRGHFHFGAEREGDDTVERVLQQSARPVVSVPQRLGGSGPVVVAYDGGIHAARALQAFQASGLESGAEVLVVSVHEDETQAAQRAEPAVAFLISHGIPAHRATVATRAPGASAILRLVQEKDARLLVAGLRDRRRLTEILFGSMTQTLLRAAQVPVFLYG
jgi:nucleotide-binding universal stress UspA family protein